MIAVGYGAIGLFVMLLIVVRAPRLDARTMLWAIVLGAFWPATAYVLFLAYVFEASPRWL